MSDKRHLPVYGVGPIYGAILILATVIGITVSVAGILDLTDATHGNSSGI